MTLVLVATPWERKALEGLPGVELLETGIGRARVRRALAARTGPKPGLVVSAGFAGALHPDMKPGDLVVDLNAAEHDTLERVNARSGELGLRRHYGRVASVDTVLATPAEKKAFSAAGRAAAVDMEWEEVRAWAAREGVPALAVKTVFDGLDDELPAGQPDDDSLAASLKYAAARPAQLPKLFGLFLRQRKAAANLRAFLGGFLA